MKKLKFNISGMTCSSCVSHVEKAVTKLNGVKNVNVNLLSNNMTLEIDENILESEEIIKAVKDAGYGISVDNKKNTNNKKVEKQDDVEYMKKRLLTSICFLIPLMYVSMHSMLNEFLKIPIPNFIKNYLDGKENIILSVFTQLLLLIPIVYINRNYFKVGYKRLLKKSPNMDSLIAIGSTASIVYGIFAMYMIGYGLRS